MAKALDKLLNYDWIMLTAVGFLLTSGLTAIYSLSVDASGGIELNSFRKQIFFLIFGIVTFLAISNFDYRNLRNHAGFFYITGVVLLVAVLIFGRNIRGTSGWFSLGFFNVQPVELVKIFLIIFLAKYFSRFSAQAITVKEVLISLGYVMVPVFFAIRQPDMGSAMVMMAIWGGMIFVAGLSYRHLAVIVVCGIMVMFLSWNFVLKDYQKTRVVSFMNPQADALGSGYNVIQSMVAIGSGGFKGKGLGYGSQSRLNFLPEKHTDFIFATIAEESGFVGAGMILMLIGLLLFRLKKTADFARDSFGRLIIVGIMVVFFFQTMINVGMNLGVMPVAGLSLPFLSYGGSFLVTSMATVGLAQSVWKKRRKSDLGSVEIDNHGMFG